MRNVRHSIILLLLSTVLLLPLPAFAEGGEQAADESADAITLAAEAPEEQADRLDEAFDAVPAEASEPAPAETEIPLLGEPEAPGEPETPIHEDGWETTDEGTFYWSGGSKVTGWLELDGSRFFFDSFDGHMYSDGIYEIDGDKYYFRPAGSSWGPEGSMGSGWVRNYGGKDYYFDRTTGKLIESGWIKDGGTWYYIDPGTSEFLTDGIYEIDGEKYYFRGEGNPWGPAGSMGRGWVEDGGNKFFFDRTDGHMLSGGIHEVSGGGAGTYYFRPADSAWGPEGSMGSGWVRGEGDPAADYYFDKSTGRMVKGAKSIGGSRYFFDSETGAMRTGWIEDGGNTYYAREDGRLCVGEIYEVDGKSYYFRPSGSSYGPEGSMGKGWVTNHKGHTYFFDRSDGHMLSGGIYEVGGAKYFFRPAGSAWGPEGSMGVGWVRNYGDPADDYFFDRDSGKLIESGWLRDFSTWYYISPETGEYLTNGIYEIDGEKYYFRGAGSPWGPEGSMGTGWVKFNGADYFFDRSSGKMYRNGTYVIDGWPYKADANGKLTREPSRYPYMLSIAQDYSSPTNYLILIDAGNNVICVYQGYYGNWAPVKESLCSTGAPATYTPSGVYYSGAQGYSFSGDGHTCYYYTQIYGDVLIHSILYHEGTFNVMDGRLGYHISGGCVRCPIDVAKWIYDNIPYYTKIVVFR